MSQCLLAIVLYVWRLNGHSTLCLKAHWPWHLVLQSSGKGASRKRHGVYGRMNSFKMKIHLQQTRGASTQSSYIPNENYNSHYFVLTPVTLTVAELISNWSTCLFLVTGSLPTQIFPFCWVQFLCKKYSASAFDFFCYSVYSGTPAQDLSLWTQLSAGLGRPCMPVTMDCAYICQCVYMAWMVKFAEIYVNGVFVKLFVQHNEFNSR